MVEPIENILLRIYIGESDRFHGKSVHTQIVDRARENGISGATVIRGVIGYGAPGQMHSAKILRISEQLPVVIEIIESEEKVKNFLPKIEELIVEGIAITSKVQAYHYVQKEKK
jgi:uncharacterized protein